MSEWTSERLRERAEQVLNGAGMDPVALGAGAQLLVAAGWVENREQREALHRTLAVQRQVEEPGSGKADPEPPFAGEFGDAEGAAPAEPVSAVPEGAPSDPAEEQETARLF